MRLLRRLVGAVVLLLSAVSIICCAAGIVGAWIFHQRVSEKVETVSAKLDGGLERASAANQNVGRVLERARADVAEVRKKSADLGGGGDKGGLASRTLRTLIREKAGPNIDDLGGRLATLSDAAVVVSSLLQSAEELPIERNLPVDPDELKRRADDAHQLSATLRRAEAALGEGDSDAGKREVADATSQVDLVLQKCQAVVDRWQSDLDRLRDDLARVKAKTLAWLTYGALAVTALLAWVGLGQVCLFGRALAWCRGA
jgi:hypothetical protein